MVNNLFLLMFTFSLGIFSQSDIHNVENSIQLEVRVNKDTVSSDGDIIISLLFTNKTNSDIIFYPRSLTYITRPFVAFGEGSSYFFYLATDVTRPHKINSGGSYKEEHVVDISSLLQLSSYKDTLVKSASVTNTLMLKKGWNELQVIYLCPKLKGKDKKYNLLYGQLSSETFQIFLKD